MKMNRQCNLEKPLCWLSSFGSKRVLQGNFPKILRLLLILLVASITLAPLSASATTCEQWVAKAVSVEGKVEAKRAGETVWQQVQPDDTFCAGDMVRVLEESRADLAF
ncbi:MAG: hypothetical protein ABFR35_10985, partial [Thermodesulfobacteriota bacterium]